MDFDFSDDQKFLKEEARRFLDAHAPLSLCHQVLDHPDAGHADAIWSDVAAQGWPGIAIPEEFGGLGATPVDLCAIAEEIGRAVVPMPFASTVYLFAQAILLAGTDAQKRQFLPRIVAGEMIGCMAITDHPDRPVTAINGALHGDKLPVIDGLAADYAIVLADGADGASLYVVDLATTERNAVESIDPTRPIAHVRFHDTPGTLLGRQGEGRALVQAVLDRAAVPMAFEQLGGADHCLELARDFSLERQAFGRPVGSFQAIKHKLADMFIQNQLARSNCYFGAWAAAAQAPELAAAAAAARVSAGDAFWLAAKEGLHVHGGMGYTWESDCQLFYRRAQHLALALGASRIWKDRLVGELLRRRSAEALPASGPVSALGG